MYLFEESGRYFAQVAPGLEEPGAAELELLGAEEVRQVHKGMHFTAGPGTLYRINLRTRLLSRVLAPLASFRCHTPDYLYRRAREIDWTDILRLDRTFAVFANVSNSKITHSKYAALKLKDAIVDQFRDSLGRRPDVDPRTPDLWLNLHLAGDRATISLDTSGGSLHRRGYRREGVEASMQETVAAAIIEWSGWDGSRPLTDPMCGSGTLLAEALIKWSDLPPGFLRKRFGFELMPGFDSRAWLAERKKALEGARELPAGLISGGDISRQAVSITRKNLAVLPGGSAVALSPRDFRAIPRIEGHVIVCNPPYGLRMKTGGRIEDFYRELGDFLKRRCTGSEAYIYFGKRELLKSIGLRPAWKKPLSNGGLDGRLARFDLY